MTGKAYVNSIKVKNGRLVQGINGGEIEDQLWTLDPSAAHVTSASNRSFTISHMSSGVKLPSLSSQVLALSSQQYRSPEPERANPQDTLEAHKKTLRLKG